jgi:small subunit ribosomal protein S16
MGMAVRIRLKRMGAKKRPFFRVVVANSTAPRDGRVLDEIGYYNPLTDPATISLNEEKVIMWLNRGAQPSEAALSLLRKTGVLEKFEQLKKSKAQS